MTRNVPLTNCRNCNTRECDDCPTPHTVNELVDETNLTVVRIDNRLTVAIAHDGTIDDIPGLVDDIRDMVTRFQLIDVVTCLSIVISQNTSYRVTPVTPSNTVWHITAQNTQQIAMGLNAIGTRIR